MEATDQRLTVEIAVKTSQVLRLDRALETQDVHLLLSGAQAGGLEAEAAASRRFGRTYMLLETPDGKTADAFLAGYPELKPLGDSIVVLAIEPTSTDALTELLDALAGAGRPAGVISAQRVEGAVVVEIDVERTAWSLIQALVAAELRRRPGGLQRVAVLNPLSIRAQAYVAAQGLQTPELDRTRILDILVADAHL